uniref:SET domain-containing protein n=2 Tax=Caenorhabditis tropicalis TaxID=1561998 RepID=A0A1I7ULV9_9PELO
MNPYYLHCSCRPTSFFRPFFANGAFRGVSNVVLQEMVPGTFFTIPFDPNYKYSEEPLKCLDHIKNMSECPMEQERRKFQSQPYVRPVSAIASPTAPMPTDGSPWRRSCQPNTFIKLNWRPDGSSPGHNIITFADIRPGGFHMTPFDADYAHSIAPLVCAIHHEDMGQCPMEVERRINQGILPSDIEMSLRAPSLDRSAPLSRSCEPNMFMKHNGLSLIIKSVKREAIPKGTVMTLPFDADYKTYENPLPCVKHLGNIDACPLEKERKRYAAQKKKVAQAYP